MTANPHPRKDKPRHPEHRHGSTQHGSVLGELLGSSHPMTKTGKIEHDQHANSTEETAQSFACHSQHATDLRMLDVRLTDGSRRALPYHFLESVDFVPAEGMVLGFATARVRVTGHRLHAIYHGLLGHRVGYLKAMAPPPPPAAPTPEEERLGVPGDGGEPVITALWFEGDSSAEPST